jgi:hypothetical protein
VKLSPNEVAYVLIDKGGAGRPLEQVTIGAAVWLGESSVPANRGADSEILGMLLDAGGSGNVDHGAGQISNLWHGDKLQAHPTWRDPYTMAELTWLIFDEAVRAGKPGWQPWHQYTSGSYEKFLPHARVGVKHPFPPISLEEAVVRRLLAEHSLRFKIKDA